MSKGKTMITTVSIDGKVEREYTESVKDACKRLEDLSDAAGSTQKMMEKASDGFTVAKGALAHLVADGIEKAISGLKNLAGSVVETGLSFSSSMAEVQAISGATGEELETLEQTAREYGATTVFSASESADALKYMSLAGWDVEQSTSALGGVLDLAAASGMELAEASDMITDYLSAFGMEADKSGYFADVLAYAQSNANTTAAQLGEAYKNVAANMSAAGQDMETTTSLLSMMANQGLKGSTAGTALAAVLRDVTAKMEDGSIAIGDTSVEVMDANGNFRDMTDILKDVEKATDGMGDAERASALGATFTADSIKGLNLMLNAGIDEAADFEEELRSANGSAAEMSETMNDNLQGDLKAMSSGFEELQLKIYDGLEEPLRSSVGEITNSVIPKLSELVEVAVPVMGDIVDALVGAMEAGIDFASGALEFIGENIDWLEPLVVGLTSAFVAYKAMSEAVAIYEGVKNAAIAAGITVETGATVATYALGSAVAFLTSPLFLAALAIGAVIAVGVLLYKNWETIKAKAIELKEKISTKFTELKESLGGIIEGIKAKFQAGFAALVGFVKAPVNTIIGMVNGVISAINGVGFTVPDWVPLIGGKSFSVNIPTIPMLASGGFTDGVSIAGEAGQEAVISFDPAYRSENLSYWAKAGQMLGATADDAELLSSSTSTSINLGGITYNPSITINGNADYDDIMKALRDSKAEFEDMLYDILDEREALQYA